MIGQIKKLLSSDSFEDRLLGAELLRKHTTIDELNSFEGFICGKHIKYITFEIPENNGKLAFVISSRCFKSNTVHKNVPNFVEYIGKHRTIEEAEE